jgi:hypothetical protein
MNNIKKLLFAFIVGCALAISAQATVIKLPTLDINNFPSYGDENVGIEVNKAILTYNAVFNTDLPTSGVGSTPDFKADNSVFGSNLLSIDLTLGNYNYIFLHWGGPDIDASYKNPELYYIGSDTGTYTFVAPWNTAPDPDTQYGLSFYSFYSEIPPTSNVPDGGATVSLLGLGVIGMTFIGRRIKL